MYAFECNHLRKVYDDGTVGLNDFTYSLEVGKFLLVAGPNGAGKTTLLRILSGEISPTSGTAKVFGHDLTTHEYEAKALIGVAPQEAGFYGYLTVAEYLYYLGRIAGLEPGTARRETHGVMRALGLSGFQTTKIENLSGGLKRRVLVAQALVGGPKLLLLDEPTAGLDPEGRRITWAVLGDLLRERKSSLVLTTHYLDEAREMADEIVVLNRGDKVFQGSVASLLTSLGYEYKVVLSGDERQLGPLERFRHTTERGKTFFWVRDHHELAEVLALVGSGGYRDVAVERPTLDESYLTVMGYVR